MSVGKYSQQIIAAAARLTCGHCNGVFSGSPSQAFKVKYEAARVYCSTACRHAALRKKFGIPRGPCPQCNQMFSSNNSKKIFCSMKCYTSSPKFLQMMRENREKLFSRSAPELSVAMRKQIAEKNRTGEMVPCLECGAEFYRRKSGKKKFCTTVCYRSYMAKRFDRWIANPEEMALPQCYDEFLDRDELPCIIDGCNWRGQFLTAHVNFAHGLKADEFKRAAGFNLKTGVIARPLAEIMQGRDRQGVAVSPLGVFELKKPAKDRVKYRSKEGAEHSMKARALVLNESGPIRECRGCGIGFRQSTVFGRTLFCSRQCRSEYYARASKAKCRYTRTNDEKGRFCWVKK